MPRRQNPNMWKGKRSMLAGDALNWKTATQNDPRFKAEVRERFAEAEREVEAEMRAERAGLFPEEDSESDSSSEESSQPLSQKRRAAGPSFSSAAVSRETPITPGGSSHGGHSEDEVAALKREIAQLKEEHERRITELQRANQRLLHENAALRAGHGADASTSTMSRRMSMMAMMLGNMEDQNLGERRSSDATVSRLRRELEQERSARLRAEQKLARR